MSSSLPRLAPPLRAVWRASTGEYAEWCAASDDVVVVASRRAIIGYDLVGGAEKWRRPWPSAAANLAASRRGPLMCLYDEENRTTLVALSWAGDVRWSLRRDWFVAADCLTAEGDRVLCVGRDNRDGAASVCAHLDDATGKLVAEYPCDGERPRMLDGALVYAITAGDDSVGGLYRIERPGGPTTRLWSSLLSTFAIAGDIAVLDTYSAERPRSELVAINAKTGAPVWRSGGGPNFTIAIDEGQVACGEARDDGVALTLRSLSDGAVLWSAAPVATEGLTTLLSADLVIAYVADKYIDLHDRGSGRLVQQLETQLPRVHGGCICRAGLVDLCGSDEIVCWRGSN